jgi:hypothetical protein
LEDGSIFACSELLSPAYKENLIDTTQLDLDFAALNCSINVIYYILYDPEAWINDLRISGLSEILN